VIILYYQYDEDGFFIQQVISKVDENVTSIPPHDGLFKPKFNNNEWVEGASKEHIENVINNSKNQPDDLTQLKDSDAFVFFQLNETQNNLINCQSELEKTIDQLREEVQLNSDLILQLVEKGVL
jgi:hypothetical protein